MALSHRMIAVSIVCLTAACSNRSALGPQNGATGDSKPMAIEVALPDTSGLDSSVAKKLSKYYFSVSWLGKPVGAVGASGMVYAPVANGANPLSGNAADCKNIEPIIREGSVGKDKASFSATLRRDCAYEVLLAIGEPDADGKFTPFPESLPPVYSREASLPDTVLYRGTRFITTSEMAGKDSLTVDISLYNMSGSGVVLGSDGSLPKTLQTGGNVDVKVRSTICELPQGTMALANNCQGSIGPI